MKNDLKEVKIVTTEMSLNDYNYSTMQKEYDDLVFDVTIGIFDDEFEEVLDKVYFFKRVLSVLSGNDIPLRAAVGFFDMVYPLEELYNMKDRFIGDDDSDSAIFEYVLEYGYRAYEKIEGYGDNPEDVLKNLQAEINRYLKEDEDDEERRAKVGDLPSG